MQWASPQEFKERLLRYRHAVPLVLVQRDSGEGSVKASRDGKSLLIDYKVSRKDKESLLAATQGAIGILLAAGSPEVSTGHILDTGFVPKRNDTESVIEEYLSSVKNWGMKEHEISLFSAHQMGSCRMSSSPHSGVVDANGETWECNDLFVMDASVFPTASGANPMLTVMTIASMLSSRLGLMLQYRDGRLGTVTAAERAKVEELALRRTTARLRDFTEIAHKVRQILWTMMLFALAVAMIATVIDL
jgi:long-chain-alcohol oxidase